jgi:hypothetical protein
VEERQDSPAADGDSVNEENGEVRPGEATAAEEDDVFLDAEDVNDFEAAPPNVDINFEEMAENYFGRADEIHRQIRGEEDFVLDFQDLSSEEEEPDKTPIMESLLRESAEPLFPGSQTNRLQFSIILMSLCTLFSVSHHCLDEILTFLKHDVLPVENTCPKSSYEMKRMLMKLGLSHD